LKPDGGDNAAMAAMAMDPNEGLAHWFRVYEGLVAKL